MLRLALTGALALARIFAPSACFAGGVVLMNVIAYAFDNGQWDNVDPATRQWFKSLKNKQGMPCCDTADGHRTTWRASEDGGYEVPINGKWVKVPPEAVLTNTGNPTGEAIVWYAPDIGGMFIRCFVPSDGV